MGLATFNANATPDPDKPAAACVWLWARDPNLATGRPQRPRFRHLTRRRPGEPPGDGTLRLRRRADLLRRLSRLTTVTGDSGYDSVLFEQAVLKASNRSTRRTSSRPAGRPRYWLRRPPRALLGGAASARLTIADARAIVVARLQRDLVQARLRPPAATQAEIADFLPRMQISPFAWSRATERAPWLGGVTQGWAVSSLAPAGLFTLAGAGEIDTTDGSFSVTPLGPVLPLGLSHVAGTDGGKERTRAARAREALPELAPRAGQKRLSSAVCLNDRMPTPSSTDLSPFVPFLLPS